jgi:molybdate transport system ATP-binding protein
MLYVPAWETYINFNFPEKIRNIGVRANHIRPFLNPKIPQDEICVSFPFEIVSEISDTFTDILLVRKKGSSAPPMRWEMSKEEREKLKNLPQELAITKKSLLYLR